MQTSVGSAREPDLDVTPIPRTQSRRHTFGMVLRLVVAIAIAASIVYAVVELWPEVRATLTSLRPAAVAASLLFALAGMSATVMAWRAVLREMDYDVSVVDSGRIYLVGQLGKYLPGSVWAVVVQMELALRAGVPRARSFAASLVLIGLSTTAAVLVGLAGLPSLTLSSQLLWLLAGLAPLALVCSLPPVLTRLVDLLMRLLRRPRIRHPFRWSGVAKVIAWCLLTWSLLGAHLGVLIVDQVSLDVMAFAQIVGTFALASVAGLFAFVAPSGFGVREGVIVAGLSPFLGAGPALAFALTSRLILTVADVVAAGAAAVSARRSLGPAGSALNPPGH